jgi:magnesium-transporting ATPase (P-type)
MAPLDVQIVTQLSRGGMLRDLDYINSAAKSTTFMFTVSLVIPIVMGCGAWALATGAAPEQPLRENYLALIGLGIAVISIIALPIPYIFRWNWETKYFGAATLSLTSASIIGVYPVLCIAQYSSLPPLIRLALVLLEGTLIIRWCKRFANIYQIV